MYINVDGKRKKERKRPDLKMEMPIYMCVISRHSSIHSFIHLSILHSSILSFVHPSNYSFIYPFVRPSHLPGPSIHPSHLFVHKSIHAYLLACLLLSFSSISSISWVDEDGDELPRDLTGEGGLSPNRDVTSGALDTLCSSPLSKDPIRPIAEKLLWPEIRSSLLTELCRRLFLRSPVKEADL